MSSELILLIILKNYGVRDGRVRPPSPPAANRHCPFKNAIKDKNSKMLQEKKVIFIIIR